MSAARKAPPRRYALDTLLRRMTPANTPPQTDWGAPVGRERLDAGGDAKPRAGQARRSR